MLLRRACALLVLFGLPVGAAPALADGLETACAQDLTFRWTSGEPIARDVIHPAPDALHNAPFLRNPELVSVRLGYGRFGPNLTVTVGKAAAAILAHETEHHHRDQMLIVLGDRVLVAAIVLGRLGSEIVLDGFPEGDLPALAERLRADRDGSIAADRACSNPGCDADSCRNKSSAPGPTKEPPGTSRPAV